MTFPQIPVVNSVKALADIVRDDLVLRGIVPDGSHVVYANGPPGIRTTPGQSQMPLVWIWLDKNFAIDVAQTGDPAAIPLFAEIDGQLVDAGASIGVEKIRAQIICQAKDPEPVPNVVQTPVPRRGRAHAVTAEEAGAQLRQRVYAAIFRRCAGSFRILAAENLSPKASEFAYGSASQFVVELYYHIADDAYPANVADQSTGTQEADGEQIAEVVEP